ncbi:MAG: hypothetical protein K2H81_04275 [Alistipes sp.]|nr:hypothetical protein [Alistipes sp.]
MKKLFLLFALFVCCNSVSAQDIIVRKDTDEIPAKVLKVGSGEIEYKKWDNPDGPVYTLPAQEVFCIKYQNGSKEVIAAAETPAAVSRAGRSAVRPRYQGEISFGYGLCVSDFGSELDLHRIVFETVHGVRVNPYFFAGVGVGVNCFFQDLYGFVGDQVVELGTGGTVLPVFADFKGYYPVSDKFAVYLAWDLGAACGVGGYFKGGSDFYTAIGPGVKLGRRGGGDFGIRFQHMGEGLNAIVFRVGLNF